MKPSLLIVLAGAMLGLCACYTEHTENAARAMPIPRAQPAALLSYAQPKADYPSVGGDILKGTSPAEQAVARAAADKQVGEAAKKRNQAVASAEPQAEGGDH